MHVKEIHDKER